VAIDRSKGDKYIGGLLGSTGDSDGLIACCGTESRKCCKCSSCSMVIINLS